MTGTRVRLLVEGDWDEVVALEERTYAASGLSEGREALRSRYRASPSTCFVVEHAGRFGGYLLALPFPLFRCPDLHLAEVDAVREGGPEDNLHVHDVVVAEQVRRRGLAHRMLRQIEETARADRHRTLSLAAVGGSRRLWAAWGFHARPGVVLPASYGAEAVYMTKPLETAATDPDGPRSSAAGAG
ncbi:GNAT family N-acetyltransferase [Streptomyces sp. NPDC002690]